MTPQERQLVADLFDRLAKLEGNKRDPQAEALIAEGLARAPHALYALVQTTLIQDEALRNADARIRELEGGGPEHSAQGGFLDNMRDVFRGRSSEGRPSVPSVGAAVARRGSRSARQRCSKAAPASGGGSFLGTAAASAAGVIGGALLLNSFRRCSAAAASNMAHARFPGGSDRPRLGAAAMPPTATSHAMRASARSAAAARSRYARTIAHRTGRHVEERHRRPMMTRTNTRTTAISSRRRFRRRVIARSTTQKAAADCGGLFISRHGSDHHDLGADLHALIQIGDVFVAHADAA